MSLGLLFVGVFLAVIAATLIWSPEKWPKWVALSTALGLSASAALVGHHYYTQNRKVEPVFVENARDWQHVPLRVRMPQDLPDVHGAIREAMTTVNREMGCELLIEIGPYAHYDVRFVFGEAAPCDSTQMLPSEHNEIAAGAYYCRDGTADIDLARLDEHGQTVRTIVHEFGRVFGLATDPVASGVMSSGAKTGHPVLLFTEKDTKALRARYCARKD